MSFPSTISRIARPLVLGRHLLSSSSSLASTSSLLPVSPSSSSSSSTLPRSFSTASGKSSEGSDHGNLDSPSSSSSSSSRPLSARRKPSSSRAPLKPSKSFQAPRVNPRIQARRDQQLIDAGSYGLAEPIEPSTSLVSTDSPSSFSSLYLSPTSLPSVPAPTPPPRILHLNDSTVNWFQTVPPPAWHRLINTLDYPTRLEYQRKAKYLKRALLKHSPAQRTHYLLQAKKRVEKEDAEAALARQAGRVKRIEGTVGGGGGGGGGEGEGEGGEVEVVVGKKWEDYTKPVNPFKGGRKMMSSAEWFELSEEEKVLKRLEARQRMIEETEEGEKREELLRKLEEMDKGKEVRERKRREREQREREEKAQKEGASS